MLFSYDLPNKKGGGSKKMFLRRGSFDGHDNALVQCRAHLPMKHAQC
jgi:hypothetical protein